jgi:multiple sugar transport system permease protein
MFISTISKGQNFFNVIYFLPNVTSIVAALMIFAFVLHPEMDILNYILSHLGLPTPMWLANPLTSNWAVILLAVWHWIGFVIIICLPNLQAISLEMYEASKIDGANGFQQCFSLLFRILLGHLRVNNTENGVGFGD